MKNNLTSTDKEISIKIKYFREAQEIEPLEVGDWIDLRLAEDVQ